MPCMIAAQLFILVHHVEMASFRHCFSFKGSRFLGTAHPAVLCFQTPHSGSGMKSDGIRAWKLGGNGATSGHSCRGTRKTRQMGVWCGGGSRDKFQNPLTGSKTRRGAPPRAAGVVVQLSGNLDVRGFGASRSGPEEREGGLGG
ncbi:hypothetical protein DFH09DRAFT_1106185 [Mycena vulgaris]|nr:hypothetical protein DFH09DRAFT_1106185 [Mycena vulgaris]